MKGNLAEDRSGRWTYADFLTWDDDQQWELIDGRAYLLAAPSPEHQEICAELLAALHAYLKGKTCKVYPAPFAVRLFPQDNQEDAITVQPDLSVVCDPGQLDEHGCNGAPRLTVEVLSPSTASRDFTVKKDLYREAGVLEYWIVDPFSREAHVYLLQERQETRKTYGIDEILISPCFDGLEINLIDIFPKKTTEGRA